MSARICRGLAAIPFAVLLGAALTGCDSADRAAPGSVAKAEVGRVPAYPQRSGDPRKGYDALINQAVITCGPPYRAYLEALGADGADPGPQFPGRTGRNLELPYPLTAQRTRSGVDLVTPNCLVCHAAQFDGRLVMGLGNAFLDMTQNPLVAVQAAGAHLSGRAEVAEWRRWAERVATISDYMVTDTIGVNSADNLSLALMAHRDPETLAWSDKPLIEPPPERPLPVAVPPWWTMRKKHALFYNGAGRGDQVRYMMLASSLCIDSVEEARTMDAWLVDVRAYLATLEPPPYPYPIDQALADRGYSLFQSNCKGCHGSYDEDWRYPNKVVALGKVGTDPEVARAGYADSDRFLGWFQLSFYGELARAAPALGYVAPPLDGVWATAPYLHNDSVPTMADLVDSTKRPRYWEFERSSGGEPVYDRNRLGWAYQSLSEGKSRAMSWSERSRIYDTSQKGYGNGGHIFGDALTRDQRLALIEYLKTL